MTKRRDNSTPPQPDSAEQSGSAGRRTGTGTAADGKDSGQGRYGQTGGGGETGGVARPDGAHPSKGRSNRGSGRPEDESDHPGKNVEKSKP